MAIKVSVPHASALHGGVDEKKPSGRVKEAFGSLLEEAAGHGKNFPPSRGHDFSLKDISLLQLAGFNPISFTQRGPVGGGLDDMASAHLSTSLYLNLVTGQDQGVTQQVLGQNILRGEGLQNCIPSGGTERSWPASVPAAGDATELGTLSARFESGTGGAGAIGYDRHGGTSYGIYQISSRQGTMDRFLEFLRSADPAMARRLSESGPSNTGSTGGSFPDQWKSIASENPRRFEDLQRRFIKETHYDPAAREIEARTGLDVSGSSPALRQVLWSTAVQHGPERAADIFQDALKECGRKGGGLEEDSPKEPELIDRVYALRSTRFGSSTPEVQAAVLSRFRQEREMALAMVHNRSPMG